MTLTLSRIKTFFNVAGRLMWHRPKGWRALLFNAVCARLGICSNLMMPVHVAIEPANTCNAACPVCETGKREMKRAKGRLDADKFYQLIDEIHAHTNILFFYFMGEPFLNPHAYDMIRYARDKGVYVETCTNGDLVDPDRLLDSGISKISFQIGGLDQETHQRYRVNSDFERVKQNLCALLEKKATHPQGDAIEVEVGFIVMRHNEHQVNDFILWAKAMGIDSYNIINPCVRNLLEAHAYLPKDRRYWFYDEHAFNQGVLKPQHIPDHECVWIWNSIQLNWNGDAVPCCRDVNGSHIFGNVFDEGFRAVWNGKKAVQFRRNILKKQEKMKLCNLCSGYGLPDLKSDDIHSA